MRMQRLCHHYRIFHFNATVKGTLLILVPIDHCLNWTFTCRGTNSIETGRNSQVNGAHTKIPIVGKRELSCEQCGVWPAVVEEHIKEIWLVSI
jgi:hypothetical protein